MFNKKEMIDPEKTMFAHLARLTDDDLEMNKLDNVNLRCTNESYIVGELSENEDGLTTFLDIMEDESFGYLYFKTVSDAEYALRPISDERFFVINARPLTDIGIRKILTKDEVRKRLYNCGLIFNFMDDEEEKVNVPVKNKK